MPIKKKKISELTLADSLTGLYTIGCKIIDGIQTSVKVSLGTIQTAYENMLTEISTPVPLPRRLIRRPPTPTPLS